jgi:hypothetical protein
MNVSILNSHYLFCTFKALLKIVSKDLAGRFSLVLIQRWWALQQ